jgi:agmatinase/guanidinopropionase
MEGLVYVTVYIDSVDSAFAPCTGTPEVGGLTSSITPIHPRTQGLYLIGFDLVEVSPPFDHGDITSILASNIVFGYLSLLAIK